MMNSSHSDMPSPSPGHDQEGVGGRGGDGSDKANHRPSHPNPNPYPYPYHHPMKKQNRLCEGLGNGGASLCRSSSSPSSSVGPTPHSDENNNNNTNTNTNNNNAVPSSSYKEHDAAYFHSYAHVGVHEEMIKDRVRTEAYRDAIFQHSDMIRNKVVVDVGCGTGILSIFCAYAGARKVYAIDASDIAVQAREVVKANKLSDTITVLLGRVEEVEIHEEVDVIVSEWMGYMLLYESMLASVICARDRWLKPGGIMLPSFATLYFAPITNSERYAESIDFWCNIYGIDMSAMIPLAKQCSFEEPCIEMISPENILSWPFVVKHFDCSTVTVQEIENVKVDFRLQSIITAPLHGFAFWFEVTFGNPSTSTNDTHSESSIDSTLSGNFQSNNAQPQSTSQIKAMNPIVLSTAPEEVPTHWQQTVIYTYEPVAIRQDQVIEGSLSLSQSKENPRFLNILLDYTCGGRYFVKESVMR